MTEEAPESGLKREFMIERQGKWTPLYAGLLDLAHQQGLKKITTNLLQIPTAENAFVAICYATVITDKGEFTGLGDASPDNVARMMVPHILRMAETRAKARALRDAVNVGSAALEEMAEMAEEEAHSQAPRREPTPIRENVQPAQSRTLPPPNGGAGHHSETATPNQIRFIYGKGRDAGLNEEQIDSLSESRFGATPGHLSKKQASDFINALQNGDLSYQAPQAVPSNPVLPVTSPQPNDPAYNTWAPKLQSATNTRAIEAMMATVDDLHKNRKISDDTYNALVSIATLRDKEIEK